MASKVRKFVKARLATDGTDGKPKLSLAQVEDMFVNKLMEKCNLVERDILRVFRRFDTDGSGFLSTDELSAAIHLYLNGVDRAQVAELVSHYDVDHDGHISLEEFTSFLISRTSPDKNSWQTVDTLIEKHAGRVKKGAPVDESNFAAGNDQNLDNSNDQSFDEEIDHPAQQQSTSHKASVFLQNTKAFLLKRAQEARMEGLIPAQERLSMHLAPLAESVARSILSKAFQPYMSSGPRVDSPAFARVLTKFTYPGSPPPRKDVVQFLFELCRDGKERADPDMLVDMIFAKGGTQINKWGFIQNVVAATDTGRPAVGRGPFVRREGDLPARVTDVPYRVNTPQSRTALAAPSDFDPRLIERSAQKPSYSIARDFVYGINLNVYSGEPVVYLPESNQEVLYAAGALMIVHDLQNSTQAYFDGHTDDITCFSISTDGVLVASGQMGKNPFVLIWETALLPEVHTQGPHSNLEGTPVGLVGRIGKGWFVAGVCATAFSCDNKYLAAIGCDDKHDMGVWSVFNGDLLANIPTAPGIPPQIRSLKWSPISYQNTGFINREHEQSQCDMIVTGGEHNFLRFWSFKRPNKNGLGSALHGRGHSTPKSVGCAPPKSHQCAVYVEQENCQDPVAQQCDVITAGDNGYVYLWREAQCIRASQALADGNAIRSMSLETGPNGQQMLIVGGRGGGVACLDPVSLEMLVTMSVTNSAIKPGTGMPTDAMRRAFVKPLDGIGGQDISSRAKDVPVRRPGSAATMSAKGRQPESHHPMAGRSSGTGRPTSAGPASSQNGIFSQVPGKMVNVKKPQTKDPIKAKSVWKGPALIDEEKPLPAGFKNSPDVLGMTIVRDSGSDPNGPPAEMFILCATGFGKMIRLPLPSAANRRSLDAAASIAAETVMHFHFAPLYGLGVCPPRMVMAPNATLFATGGDDCWMCLWNADTRKQVVRIKARAPIRSLCIDPVGALFAVGLAGGAFTLYACDVSNTAAKTIRSQGKSVAAFQRATDYFFETNLVEHVHRRDCKEDIADIKFSPNGRMLAVASHDNYIDIYAIKYTKGSLQHPTTDVTAKHMKRLRGHSSAVLHIDWSRDNRLLQSSCAAHEILYWDIAQGRQLLSSQDCVEADTDWATESCHLGFSVMGIWGGGNQKGSDINSVDVSRGLGTERNGAGAVVATGDDHGRLQIFNYPCVVKDSPHLTSVGHSSHIMTTKWLENGGRGFLGTTGGNDNSVIVWRIQPK